MIMVVADERGRHLADKIGHVCVVIRCTELCRGGVVGEKVDVGRVAGVKARQTRADAGEGRKIAVVRLILDVIIEEGGTVAVIVHHLRGKLLPAGGTREQGIQAVIGEGDAQTERFARAEDIAVGFAVVGDGDEVKSRVFHLPYQWVIIKGRSCMGCTSFQGHYSEREGKCQGEERFYACMRRHKFASLRKPSLPCIETDRGGAFPSPCIPCPRAVVR